MLRKPIWLIQAFKQTNENVKKMYLTDETKMETGDTCR